MAFFDEFKEKAADLAQVGMAKSKQLAEIARLNLINTGEEDTIRSLPGIGSHLLCRAGQRARAGVQCAL